MPTLIQLARALWGRRAGAVARAYARAFDAYPLIDADLAMFCNAAAPNAAASEFERGVEEGKRRVWLHIARMRRLRPDDFVSIADGERIYDDL